MRKHAVDKSIKKEIALNRISEVQHSVELSIDELKAIEVKLLAWREYPKAVAMYADLHKITKRLKGIL